MALWKSTAFPKLKLWEFYTISLPNTTTAFTLQWHQTPLSNKYIHADTLTLPQRAELLLKDALVIQSEGTRFSKSLDPKLLVEFIKRPNLSLEQGLNEMKRVVDECNVAWYREYDADVASIHENIMNRVMYLRISEHGPRVGGVSAE